MERCAGVLAAVSSLPANQGIGDFGRKTKMFIDQIADAGFRIWQVLPMQPLGYGNSPYQPYSSFAGEPIFHQHRPAKRAGTAEAEQHQESEQVQGERQLRRSAQV